MYEYERTLHIYYNAGISVGHVYAILMLHLYGRPYVCTGLLIECQAVTATRLGNHLFYVCRVFLCVLNVFLVIVFFFFFSMSCNVWVRLDSQSFIPTRICIQKLRATYTLTLKHRILFSVGRFFIKVGAIRYSC